MAEGDCDAHHPSPGELERFLLGELSPHQAAPLIAHLVRGCGQCQARMAPLATTILSAGNTAPEPASVENYDFPLFKAFANARRYAETMARERAEVVHEPILKEVPLPETLSNNDRVTRDRSRCEALIEECRALRSSDPERMVLTAEFAVALAERLTTGSGEIKATADLQARAWAELGNARRIADDMTGAESDLVQALERAGHGTGDPLLLAQLMHLTASLYIDQRRFDEARRLLDFIYAIYEREGDRHLAARALISKGLCAGYAFEVHEAVLLLARGLTLLDGAREPKLVLAAIHNLIWCLVECGQGAQAERLFRESRLLYARFAEKLDSMKARWLEGRIAAAIGDNERAEKRFQEALSHFETARLPYEMALVSLDMATLWLRSGRTIEIRQIIQKTITVFRDRGIRREALGMLIVLREALKKEQATESLLRTVAAELLRLENASPRKSWGEG
jgi:tetratricopeptide (TPR) repeat protein